MKTKLTLVNFTLLFCLATSFADAQDQDATSAQAAHKAARAETSDQLLSQFSVRSALGGDNYSVPKAAIKTYKFTALIGKAKWEFNLFNSVPAMSVNEADSEQYVRHDLLKHIGGLINISMGRTGYFGNGNNHDMEEISGARFEFRLGAKALDVLPAPEQEREFIPVLQSTIDFRYMIPLFNYDKNADNSTLTSDKMVGNLSFRFIGAYMYVMNTTVYNLYYSDRKGIPPSPSIFAGQFDANFYITNQIFINAGYAFATEKNIKPLPFFSISYGRSSN